MPPNRLPVTPSAVSARSAASDALSSLDTQPFLTQLLAQQSAFGELAVVSSFLVLRVQCYSTWSQRLILTPAWCFSTRAFIFPETLAYRDELIVRTRAARRSDYRHRSAVRKALRRGGHAASNGARSLLRGEESAGAKARTETLWWVD